ncbi:uncharacterized protein LOC108147088 [Drosophila elegans]|uniref:uncharacterized protein LOC108147088 n=1 Tax=Drosophila elegans TaxID=30023 RepID=UPI0007E72CC2|nr:uncharacterized protein LOC108147088 [Drosophila elegans]
MSLSFFSLKWKWPYHSKRMRHVHRCEGCRGRAAATPVHKRLMPREEWRPYHHPNALGG